HTTLGGLDAMVGRVPDQMQERVTDLVENRPVQLDLLPLHIEPDPLAEVARQIPHQTGEPIEYISNRGHSRGDDLALHPGDESRDPVAQLAERRIAALRSEHREPVLGHDQLTYLIHQRVETPEVDPDLAARRESGDTGCGQGVETHRLHIAGRTD